MGFPQDTIAKINTSYSKKTKTLGVLSEKHILTEKEILYTASTEELTVVKNNGTYLILGVTSDTDVHFLDRVVSSVMNGTAETNLLVELYEGVTTSDDGTLLEETASIKPVINTARDSTNTPKFKIYLQPTITDFGKRLCALSGRLRSEKSQVSSSVLLTDYSLKKNTKYAIKLTNVIDSTDALVCVKWVWEEGF